MKHITINDASEGDVAAVDLINTEGLVLLPKGVELSASMINRLKKMGVTEIDIEEGLEEKNAEKERQLSLLEERFKGCETDPYLSEMKVIAAEHIQMS